MDTNHQIQTEEALEKVIGEPLDFVKSKVVKELDDEVKGYIQSSPLVFIATHDQDGNIDVSPKGDPRGFVGFDEQGSLVIPERPGNKLTFGFRNILRNPRIGLIFVVPGQRETLRVKGTATLHTDPDVLEQLQVNGKPALLYTRVAVEECFFHCGKAMIRSKLWKPDSWVQAEQSPMVQQVSKILGGGEETAKLVEEEIEKDYRDALY